MWQAVTHHKCPVTSISSIAVDTHLCTDLSEHHSHRVSAFQSEGPLVKRPICQKACWVRVVIPTGRYSDSSIFRQVVVPTGRYSDKQVVIPTGRYSDRSLFRQVDIPTNRSLFWQVDSPTNRSLFRQVDSPTNRVEIPKGLYSDRSLFRHKNNSNERITTINSYCGPHFFVQLWYIDAFRSIVKLNMPTSDENLYLKY